jgi:1,4-alpha-glucan branching enzyme
VALHKQSAENGKTLVTFQIPAEAGAGSVQVLGDFNAWSPTDLQPSPTGGYELSLRLESGRAYRFRYLLDGHRWENDWQADSYVPNEYGGDDSLIDLTPVAPATAEIIDLKPDVAAKPKRPRRKTSARSA